MWVVAVRRATLHSDSTFGWGQQTGGVGGRGSGWAGLLGTGLPATTWSGTLGESEIVASTSGCLSVNAWVSASAEASPSATIQWGQRPGPAWELCHAIRLAFNINCPPNPTYALFNYESSISA